MLIELAASFNCVHLRHQRRGWVLQAKRYIVRGRVQGVGFRWFVEREAAAMGLVGWVRNNEDSTVELVAAGDPEQLAVLKQRLEEGPRASRVDHVDELEPSPDEVVGNLKSFQIRGAW